MLSEESTKEEVAEYLLKNCKLDEKTKTVLINEDISGDIILDIQDAEFKSIGIKIGTLKKIKKALEPVKDKIKKKNLKIIFQKFQNQKKLKAFLKDVLILKKI